MSFRNISRQQDYSVLRTRPAKPSDEKEWHDIYPPQLGRFFGNIRKFAVSNWIPVVVGLTAGIVAAVGGFYIGQTYSTANIGKKLATRAVDLLPKKIQAEVKRYM